jgi:hypothetical protein
MGIHRDLHYMYQAGFATYITAAAQTISCSKWGEVFEVTTTGSSDTLTLNAPTKPGIECAVVLSVDAGNLVLTVTGGYNFDGDTAISFADAGDFVVLKSIQIGSNYRWRVIAQEGTNTSTETGTFDLVIADTINHPSTDLNEHGAGAIGTGVAPRTNRFTRDRTIITEISLDLTGLASVATANDVIGLSTGGNAYIGRNVVADNGVIYKMELACIETPVGGDDDINIVANASGTLAYDGAGGTTYGVNGGDAVAGQVVENLVQGLTDGHYLYLTAGTGDTAAAYTAGQFMIRLHGHALLT